MNRDKEILASIKNTNEPALYKGKEGFWVQGECAFIVATNPSQAIEFYRTSLGKGEIPILHNDGTHAIANLKAEEKLRKGW